MEDISAFAAYHLKKSISKKKKNKNGKTHEETNNLRPTPNNSPQEYLKKKQLLIKEIVEKQFQKKENKLKNRKKNNISDLEDFATIRKLPSSTPNKINKDITSNSKNSVKILSTTPIEKAVSINGKKILKNLESNIEKNVIGDTRKAFEIVDSSSANNDKSENITTAPSKVSVSKKFKKEKSYQNDNILPTEITDFVDDVLNIPKNNSISDGEKIFKWLIRPVDFEEFFQNYWEKAPCLIQKEETSFSDLLSFEMINQMLLDNYVEFTKNIDITKYENEIRETINPEGRALPAAVWEKYSDGCSVRLLNPQTFLPSIYSLNSTLQEFFHCMVGANVYLTPPNSQGFAPHYDDIEAFVLQIEGKKHWRLYNPRNKNEVLPRFSSENFLQNEIGEPILDTVLKPGQMLYFPRGIIHQANTVEGFHSLHITISVYQKQSYADLFEKLFPLILQNAIENDVEIRRGLPLDIWSNMGIVHSDGQSNEREKVIKHVRNCLRRAVSEIPIDEAVDQLAKKFQHEALPPDITKAEKCRTVFGVKNYLDQDGKAVCDFQITADAQIRLLRAHILRLVEEEGTYRIYYYIDNSKEYKEFEQNFLEIAAEDASVVDVLIKTYPDYIYVKDLPLVDIEQKIEICQGLWDRGLILTRDPIC